MTISNEMLGAAKIKVLGVGGGGCNAITRKGKAIAIAGKKLTPLKK